MNARIRYATKRDAEAICHVLHRSFIVCCQEDHQNDNAVLASWLRRISVKKVSRMISLSSFTCLIAEEDEIIVGVILLTNHGEIVHFYLIPEVSFEETGTRLLRFSENKMMGMGVRILSVYSVKSSLSFYLQHGFEERGSAIERDGIMYYPMTKLLALNVAGLKPA